LAQAKKLRDDNHVAWAQLVDQAAQLGLAAPFRRNQVLNDLPASCVPQRLPLHGQGVLIAGFGPDVANLHDATSAVASRSGTALQPCPRHPDQCDHETRIGVQCREGAGAGSVACRNRYDEHCRFQKTAALAVGQDQRVAEIF